MKKKLISSLLAAAMVVGMLAGCGNTSGNADSTSGTTDSTVDSTADSSTASSGTETAGAASEEGVTTTSVGTYTIDNPYHLIFEFCETNETDADARAAVEAAVNEYMIPNYQIEVEFLPMSIADYYANTPLMLTSGEDLDVFPIMFSTASSWISMGGVLDLTPYMDSEEGQKIIEALGDEETAYAATRNGVLFGFPANKEFYSNAGLFLRADICDELGLTEKYNLDKPNADIYDGTGISWDDAESMFATVKEAYPDMTIFYLSTTCLIDGHYDRLDDGFGVLDMVGDREGTTVVNKYETEQYREHVKRMADWYEKGYIYKDAATGSSRAEEMMRAGNTFAYPTGIRPNSLIEGNANNNCKCYIVHVEPEIKGVITTSDVSFMNAGIATQSKDPEMAFKFISALYSDPTLFNLWQFGIEGVHYQLLEDGTAYYVEGEDASNYKYHQNSGWQMGDQFKGLVWNDGTSNPDFWESMREHNQKGYHSPAYGFMWDSTDYSTELTALNAVKEEYINQLETGTCGSANVDKLLDEFNAALYKVGLQDIIDEKQAQIDAWLAAQ